MTLWACSQAIVDRQVLHLTNYHKIVYFGELYWLPVVKNEDI